MTSDRLRSLVVVPEPPLKEGRGSGRLVVAMAHGLAAHGVDVRLLAARQAFAIPGQPPDDVDLEVIDEGVQIAATVRTADRTGIEMEALTAVSVAALTVIDMVKAVDRHARITDVRVTAKSGGRSGDWVEEP